MEVTLEPLADANRPVVERLWQLYLHDLSQFRGLMPDVHGRYPTQRLTTFFDDDDRCGYLIRVDAAPAGFALVRDLGAPIRVLGEFFVVRAARARHVGSEAATQVLRQHPGRWEIAFQEANPTAARFWRRLAARIGVGPVTEEPRPIPGRPQEPPDTWLALTVAR